MKISFDRQVLKQQVGNDASVWDACIHTHSVPCGTASQLLTRIGTRPSKDDFPGTSSKPSPPTSVPLVWHLEGDSAVWLLPALVKHAKKFPRQQNHLPLLIRFESGVFSTWDEHYNTSLVATMERLWPRAGYTVVPGISNDLALRIIPRKGY